MGTSGGEIWTSILGHENDPQNGALFVTYTDGNRFWVSLLGLRLNFGIRFGLIRVRV